MSQVSMVELQAITDLADALYDFLPGKPHPYGDPALSFPAAAQVVRLGALWRGGSKRPALAQLLRDTLEQRRSAFCDLILAIVNAAMIYRSNKSPLTRGEIDQLNDCVQRLGFKIPELWSPTYLNSLPGSTHPAVGGRVPRDLNTIRQRILGIEKLEPHERGYAFERFLTDLFVAFGLAAEGAYRVVGEQIDGSFMLDAESYLVEARWRGGPAPAAWLYEFAGKIERKAQWTRGLFVSYSGFTEDGLGAFSKAPTRIICIDGLDLFEVVSDRIDLVHLLRKKVERAAKTGNAFVPARELL